MLGRDGSVDYLEEVPVQSIPMFEGKGTSMHSRTCQVVIVSAVSILSNFFLSNKTVVW